MLTIKKLRADTVLDHAAQELKKYLRMMMPECGEIDIFYDPKATDGFRLGLMEDFGLPNEAADPVLDDVIHIDTTAQGGILAGSNPRSVLFAVYRFLRENGCRWLYPGVDGDYVPMQDIQGVKYHKQADHRFRGFCNEGSEIQSSMLECADYYAKLEMNVYMLEWFIPNGYYNRYYSHLFNEENRLPEEVSDQQVLQWKRQCEAEISKRGLMFHDIGHGWTCKPFGFPANNNANNVYDVSGYTDEDKKVLAMLNGKRDFFRNVPIYTNVCMSDPAVRAAVVKGIADYAQTHHNIDYLHVWLSDGSKNHCECDACQKMRPSDWYMVMMNELDEELTERKLDTRIVFISYVDTMFGPEQVTIRNPQRFSLLYAPISRSYTASITEDSVIPEPLPYVRNAWKTPASAEESFAQLKHWRNTWKGPVFSYEYHFWRHQFLDPGGITFARRVHEDVRSLKVMEMDGYVEDGSQRSGFPNAFPVYIYAETLMNRECDFDAVLEDYFSHIYGKDWREALALLKAISDTFDFAYMEGERSKDKRISDFYDPDRVEQLSRIQELAARERAAANKHLNMPTRPQTVSWRLLLRHAEYCQQLAQILLAKAAGHNYKAVELAKDFFRSFGKYEIEMEPYYDHCLACRSIEHIIRRPQGIILD